MRPGIVIAVFVAGLAGFATASVAAAQPAPPPKPGLVIPPVREPPATDETFLPPLRGTPGGRISGGTRGLQRPGGTASPAAPSVRLVPPPPAPVVR